eukprot:TRINITY_DN26829_c0_g1_i1.p1 TRINITY_DN26829_c0_g1~~TRINITY_DN26829_c0_g1_i1.p1  ORF type:complete len:498 (-),score=92.01 TRINITY_DN26829_c0_g1_i1:30-1385(-)
MSCAHRFYHKVGDFIEKKFVYSAVREVRYKNRLMAFASLLLLLIVPIYLIFEALRFKSYQGTVETTPYFHVDYPQGGTDIADLDSVSTGLNSTYYSYNFLLVQETNQIMLVTTRIIDQIQEQKVCGIDDLNPALSCTSDSECQDFYLGASNPTCNATTGLCQFKPFRRWCVINQTDSLTPNPTHLQVNVIARVVCQVTSVSGKTTGVTFSNYNAVNKAEQFNYTIDLNGVLRELYSTGEITANVSTLVQTGLDLRIEYDWSCDLDNLNQDGSDRYHCPIDINAHVLSKSSNTTTSRVVWFKEDNGTLTRRYQMLYGFRCRFAATGGCAKTTLNSFLQFVAGGMTLTVIHTVVLGIGAVIFHRKYGVEEPCDVIIPGDNSSEWVLSAWGEREVVLNGKRKGSLYIANSANQDESAWENQELKDKTEESNRGSKGRSGSPNVNVEMPEQESDQ